MKSKYQEQVFNDLVKKVQKDAKETIKNLASERDLIDLAAEFAETFSTNHVRGEGARYSKIVFYYVGSVNIIVYLGKEDKSTAINPMIDAMIKDSRLNLIKVPPKELFGSIATWSFFVKKLAGNIDVDVYYEQSESCMMVETGEYSNPRKIYKLVCSD